jgi:hypothetical protein
MKRIASFLTLAAATVLFTATGCLKDKGFEAGNYGIQIAEVKGVAFPAASRSPLGYGLDVSASPQVINGLLYVTVEAANAAESDITVGLSNTTGTATSGDIAAYNAAHGTNVQVLPSALWNIPASVVIPAGAKNVMLPVTVTNTTSLDPNQSYGISITMTSASSGYQVAANQRKVLVIFSVKNQYDGKYTLRGQFYHPTSAPTYPWYTTNVDMITTGPQSVKMYSALFGGYYHPWSTGSSLTAFAGQEPEYTVNPATNKVTVQNTAPGAVTFYTMGKGFNNAGYNSRWEPATKTMYANFGYNMSGDNFVAATTRMWVDTLIRTGPR